MWILESDDAVLSGKRLWLRPGTKHLLGRAKKADSPDEKRTHAISDKSVSRTHVIISVDKVKEGDGTRLHTRSQITLEDCSKVGTLLDGERFVKEKRTLSGTSHTIQLGTQGVFKCTIKWHPIVLTFASVKASKNGHDPLTAARARLEPLDIKLSAEFVQDRTTHTVANKRNIPKGLQALLNGRYVVRESYVDAIAAAADAQEDPRFPGILIPSALEEDYDRNWPEPLLYVPSPGREPVIREADVFAPNEKRGEVFKGYTFVFGDNAQYDSLGPVIPNGSGKALFYNVVQGVTKPDDFIKYVREVMGNKGVMDSDENIGPGKGVVVVRLTRPDEGMEDWLAGFVKTVDLALGQRSVEQNEFLDAILMNDAKPLKRPLEEEEGEPMEDVAINPGSSMTVRAEPQSVAAHDANDLNATNNVSQMAPSQPTAGTRRRFRRAVTESRFRGFDDFDPTTIKKQEDDEEQREVEAAQAPESMEADNYLQGTNNNSQSLFVGGSQTQQTTRSVNTRKRGRTEDDEPPESLVDSVAPAAAAMKRRRLEQLQQSGVDPETFETVDEAPTVPPPKKLFNTRKVKDVDVLEEVRERRRQQDEAAEQDQEAMKEGLENLDISALRNLAQIEEMEVLPREARIAARGQETSNGWDERWNGRKNFKRFKKRRPGDQGDDSLPRPRRAIVPYEEYKKKDYGMGEDYWNGSNNTNTQNSKNKSQSQAQASAPAAAEEEDQEDEEGPGRFIPRRSRRSNGRESESQQQPPEVIDLDPEEGTAPNHAASPADNAKEMRAPPRTSKGKEKQTTLVPDSQSSRGKRPASSAATSAGQPGKRKRTLNLRVEDSESSEDELKFQFRRKRKKEVS